MHLMGWGVRDGILKKVAPGLTTERGASLANKMSEDIPGR